MSGVLLEATALDKGYGRIRVLRDVSLTIGAGESHVVIGPNGAGKTTLFKVLTGELYPDRGAVRFDGQDVTRLPAHRRVHLGFGRTFQVAKVFPKLNVQDNLLVALEARVRRILRHRDVLLADGSNGRPLHVEVLELFLQSGPSTSLTAALRETTTST